MGTIYLKNQYGSVHGFNIAGDQPTAGEASWINDYMSGKDPSSQPAAPEATGYDSHGLMGTIGQGIGSGLYQAKSGAEGMIGEAIKGNSTAEGLLGSSDSWHKAEQADTDYSKTFDGPQGGIEDQPGLYGKTKFMAYQFGNSLPMTVGATIGAMAAPEVIAGSAALGFGAAVVGGGIASLPQNYQQNVEEQKQANPNKPVDTQSAFLGAVGQSALEGLGERATLGVAGLVGRGARTITPALTETVKKATAKGFAKYAAKVGETVAAGTASEAVTEAAQQGIQRWQASEDMTSPEALHDYVENAVVGGLMGGFMGGGFGVAGAVNEHSKLKKLDQIKKDLAAADAATAGGTANLGANIDVFRKAAENDLAANPNAPADDGSAPLLLTDQRPDVDLLTGPNVVQHYPADVHPAAEEQSSTEDDMPKRTPPPTANDNIVPEAAPVAEPTPAPAPNAAAAKARLVEEPAEAEGLKAGPLFTEDQYNKALDAIRGSKKVSAHSVAKAAEVPHGIGKHIYNAMLDRGDTKQSGKYARPVNAAPAGVNTTAETKTEVPLNEAAQDSTPPQADTTPLAEPVGRRSEQQGAQREYRVMPVLPHDVAAFNIRRSVDGKTIGPGFKTADEAANFAANYPIGEHVIEETKTPNEHGVYEITQGGEGRKPSRRFVKSFPNAEAAHTFAGTMNPAKSVETNENEAKAKKDEAINNRAKEILGKFHNTLNKFAEHILGKGKTAIDLLPFIQAHDGSNATIEGVSKLDDAGQRIIQLAAMIHNPNLSMDQRLAALNSVLTHELVHAAKASGMFSKQEWNRLVRRASQRVPGKNYTYMERAAVRTEGAPQGASLTEEAVAEMVRDMHNDPAKFDKDTRTLLQKIIDFVTHLGRYANQMKAGNQVMQDFLGGKMADRPVDLERAKLYKDPYFSSVKINGAFTRSSDYVSKMAAFDPDKVIAGDKWLGYLANDAKASNEELNWLGLKQFLAGKKAVSATELNDFIAANSLDVQEDIRGDTIEAADEMYRLVNERRHLGDELTDAWIKSKDKNNYRNTSAWEQGQIDNNTEWGSKVRRYREIDQRYKSMKSEATFHGDTTQKGGESYQELLIHMPHLFPKFKVDQHFRGYENIMAHVRFKTRNVGGLKTLFIEEIQSDLHQRGKVKGYTSASDAQQLSDLRDERKALDHQRGELVRAVTLRDEMPSDEVKAQAREINNRIRDLDQQIEAMLSVSNIPEAPFKTSWDALAIKRLVKHAIDNGHDAISWHGEPKSVALTEGYGLLREEKDEAGNPVYKTQSGHNVTGVVNFYVQKLGPKLEKMFNTPEFGYAKAEFQPKEVSKEQDKENLIHKYLPFQDEFDGLMTRMAEDATETYQADLAKKYTKAAQIAMNQRTYDPIKALDRAKIDIDDFLEHARQVDPEGVEWSERSLASAAEKWDDTDNVEQPNVDRWVMKITPEMKGISEGFPLFTGAKNAAYSATYSERPTPDTPQFRAWFGKSKVVDDNGKPLVVYHGTMKDFGEFRAGMPNGYFGGGFYFTDTPSDASMNYADRLGGDLQHKISAEFHRRMADPSYDDEYRGLTEGQIMRKIGKIFMEHDGAIVPAYMAIQNPVIFGGEKETQFDQGMRDRLVQSVDKIQDDYLNVNSDQLASQFASYYEMGEVVSAEDIRGATLFGHGMRDAIDPETGMQVAPEVLRKALEAMGFDGIIDHMAGSRFNGMPGINQQTTHYIGFRPNQIKSVNNLGSYDPNDNRILYSATTQPAYAATAPMGQRVPTITPRSVMDDIEYRATYNNVAPRLGKLLGYAFGKKRGQEIADKGMIIFANKALGLEAMIDDVRKNGGSAYGGDDTAMQLQLMGGRIDHQMTLNEKDYYNKMAESVKALPVTEQDRDQLLAMHPSNVQIVDGVPTEKASVRNLLNAHKDVKMAMAETYLYAQHAKERNAVMRERNQDLAALGMRVDQYNHGSGMSDAEADSVIQFVQSKPWAHNMSDLSNPNSVRSRMRALIKNTNDTRVHFGLNKDFRTMTDKQGNPVERYQDYVPLRGFLDSNPNADDEITKTYARISKSLTVAGKEDRNALGRASEAAHIIANAVLQNQEAVARGFKNEVGQSFLHMLQSNAGLALDRGANVAAQPLKDLAEIVPLTQQKPAYDRKTGAVVMRNHPRSRDPDMMVVKVNGDEVGIQVKDANLRQALLGNQMFGDTGANALIKGLLRLNRIMALVRTSWNPEFIIGNFFRDTQHAMVNLTETEVKGMRTKVLTSVLPAIKGVHNALKGDGSTEWAQAYNDFAAHGGKTSFMGRRNLEVILENMVKATSEDHHGNLKKIGHMIGSVGEFIDGWNDAVENGIRVATFKHLSDSLIASSKDPTNPQTIRRAKDIAAKTAKNLTVNFNAGGTGKPVMNALYLFYNASMQGSMSMINPLIRSSKIRRVWMAAVAGGIMQDMLMSALSGIGPDGQKDYDKLDEQMLSTNMIFANPFSDRGYIKIPMPYLFNSAWNSGRAIARYARGGYTAGQTASSVFGTAVEALNPWGAGGSFLNTVAPTIVDPLVDLTLNKDFTGKPVAPPKDPYSPKDIPSQRYWNNTSPAYVGLADWMDKISGGDGVFKGELSFSPNQYEYMFNFLGGGTVPTIMRAWNMVVPEGVGGQGNLYKWASGEEVSKNDIPFLRRFTGNLTSREDLQAYIQKRDQVLSVREALRDAAKTGDMQQYQQIMQDYPAEYKQAARINGLEEQRRKLSGMIKKVNANTKLSDDEKKKIVDPLKQRQTDLVNEANRFMSTQ